jgi:hypothetical protein
MQSGPVEISNDRQSFKKGASAYQPNPPFPHGLEILQSALLPLIKPRSFGHELYKAGYCR